MEFRFLDMVGSLGGFRPFARARQASRAMANVPIWRHWGLLFLECQDRPHGSQRQRRPSHQATPSPRAKSEPASTEPAQRANPYRPSQLAQISRRLTYGFPTGTGTPSNGAP